MRSTNSQGGDLPGDRLVGAQVESGDQRADVLAVAVGGAQLSPRRMRLGHPGWTDQRDGRSAGSSGAAQVCREVAVGLRMQQRLELAERPPVGGE